MRPGHAQGEMIGFLYVQFPSGVSRSMNARTRLATITADNMAMALVSLKLREALRTQSVRDPLTRLFNRRYMEETLDRELSRCKRSGEEIGVMIFDVDNFKSYNDSNGHDAGDFVLTEISRLIHAHLRKGDVACRYGGEEFVVIMPGAPVEAVMERADRIRRTVEEHEFVYKGQSLEKVTVSIGVSSHPVHGEAVEEVVKAADSALYQAKQAGRNRVVNAGY